jgi:hypothetical protein
MAADFDFHVEDRPAGAIFLRAASEAAHNWVAVHPISGQVVRGGAIVQKEFVAATLADIARAGLTTTKAMPAMVRSFKF